MAGYSPDNSYVKFCGVKINTITYRDAYQCIKSKINNNSKGYVCLTDVGNVIAATEDHELYKAINESLLSLADGTPLTWYAKLIGHKQIERISGMDLMVNMFSERDDMKHFLLGDTADRIDRVIEKAKCLNDNIRITGFSPPFKEFALEDNYLMLEKIRAANPDVVWVSFGGGKQEKWMFHHFSELNRGIMMGVGAAFKWIIGDLKVPPLAIQRLGLQWSFRLVQEIVNDPRGNGIKHVKVMLRKIKFLRHLPAEIIKNMR